MRKIYTALIILIIIPSAVLTAHPHMFVDMKLTPVFSENSFEGVRVNWLFDMVFTGSVLMDNGIGWKESFSEEEIETIRTTSFENLESYNYFTYFNAGGVMNIAETFSSFTAFMNDTRLGYEFFLPYPGKNQNADEIRIAVYDKTFFTDIAFTENVPVSIEAPPDRKIEWILSEDRDAPIFYDNTAQMVSRDGAFYSGQTFPVELVLTAK